MADIKITISGPGGCIAAEGFIVKRALEAAGIPVLLVDKYPSSMSEEEVLAHLASLKKKMSVEIEMVHCPWGG